LNKNEYTISYSISFISNLSSIFQKFLLNKTTLSIILIAFALCKLFIILLKHDMINHDNFLYNREILLAALLGFGNIFLPRYTEANRGK